MRLSQYLPRLPETHSIAVFVGAMARGRDDFADAVVDEKISISDYQLSASVACGKVRKRDVTSIPVLIVPSFLVLLCRRRNVGHHLKSSRRTHVLLAPIGLVLACLIFSSFFSFPS